MASSAALGAIGGPVGMLVGAAVGLGVGIATSALADGVQMKDSEGKDVSIKQEGEELVKDGIDYFFNDSNS